MTLKINYLDKKKDSSKNRAFFVGSASKTDDFNDQIDEITLKNILKFKKGNNFKEQK